MTDTLFDPIDLNAKISLRNRIVMAPMTRNMADDNLVPTQQMIDYYARRADSGLIITEATIIRADAQGYPNTPGIFSEEQIAGWKKVTQAVQAKGAKIFLQIWHTGRAAHPYFFDGEEVIAPSALKLEGSVPRMRTLEYVTPRAAEEADLELLIEDFSQAAENAIRAGFDGVEIHGANGYLIDQFLHFDTNKRTDNFGETPENMARFPLAVVDAVVARIGAERTALRVSPGAFLLLQDDPRDRPVFEYYLSELQQRALAYLHVGIFDDAHQQFDFLGGSVIDFTRAHYKGILMGVGGFNAESGREAILKDRFDLLAIGRAHIANPDYAVKLKSGEPLIEYDEKMLAELN